MFNPIGGASQAVKTYLLTSQSIQGLSGDPDGGADAATKGLHRNSPAASVTFSAQALKLSAARGDGDGDGDSK